MGPTWSCAGRRAVAPLHHARRCSPEGWPQSDDHPTPPLDQRLPRRRDHGRDRCLPCARHGRLGCRTGQTDRRSGRPERLAAPHRVGGRAGGGSRRGQPDRRPPGGRGGRLPGPRVDDLRLARNARGGLRPSRPERQRRGAIRRPKGHRHRPAWVGRHPGRGLGPGLPAGPRAFGRLDWLRRCTLGRSRSALRLAGQRACRRCRPDEDDSGHRGPLLRPIGLPGNPSPGPGHLHQQRHGLRAEVLGSHHTRSGHHHDDGLRPVEPGYSPVRRRRVDLELPGHHQRRDQRRNRPRRQPHFVRPRRRLDPTAVRPGIPGGRHAAGQVDPVDDRLGHLPG